MSDSIKTGSDVPGLENITRKENSAIDTVIGAASYWHKQAVKRQTSALILGATLGAVVTALIAFLR